MYLYLLLITSTIVNAGVVSDTKCDGVIIDGHYYEKEILKTGLGETYGLDVDYYNNIVYFSYNNNNSMYASALFDLKTKEYKNINHVSGQRSTHAVDQNTHDVYIGGNDGIYKYDHKHNKSELYVANDKIWGVFFKDVLYFIKYLSQKMYTYIDGDEARFKDMEDTKVLKFVIDGEDVMFYSNVTGLFAKRKGGKNVYLYSKAYVWALTLDVHGHAYMCTSDAIYKIDKIRMSLEKLFDVNNCRGLAFDSNNNIIYNSELNEGLVRFKKIHVRYCGVNTTMYTVFPIP